MKASSSQFEPGLPPPPPPAAPSRDANTGDTPVDISAPNAKPGPPKLKLKLRNVQSQDSNMAIRFTNEPSKKTGTPVAGKRDRKASAKKQATDEFNTEFGDALKDAIGSSPAKPAKMRKLVHDFPPPASVGAKKQKVELSTRQLKKNVKSNQIFAPANLASAYSSPPSSSPDTVVNPYDSPSTRSSPPTFRPSKDTIVVYDMLIEKCPSGVLTQLPALECGDDNKNTAWTAKLLTQLYIYSYTHAKWHFCDIIVDTWIRAFHKENREADRHNENLNAEEGGKKKIRPWMTKSLLYKNPHLYREEGASELPKSHFKVKEVKLAKDITTLRRKRTSSTPETDTDSMLACVNLLYANTPRTCPARLVWADALALHASHLATLLSPPPQSWDDPLDEVSGPGRTDYALHADLVWDIMSTSLRMVRRKLTLKCEEITEGAWCERYHLHGKMGEECYRVVGKREREWEETQEEARKGGKKVSFAVTSADGDGYDSKVDAEGESEEE